MATKKIIVTFGNSEFDATGKMTQVPSSDMKRWLGQDVTTTYPFDVTVPGIWMWQTKLPYASRDTRNITGSGVGSVTFSGAVLAANQVDQWVYVKTATVGQGQHAKVTGGAGTNTATVTGLTPWVPPTGATATLEFWPSSHSCGVGSTTTAIVKSATTTAFVAGDVGKWVSFLSGVNLGMCSKITAVNSATSATLDPLLPLPLAPAAGDGFCILSAGGVQSMADYNASNASWQPLRYFYDFSFTYGTGYDYSNYRAYPLVAPATEVQFDKPVNHVPEMTWQIKQLYQEDLYVIHLAIPSSRLSPFFEPLAFVPQFSWLRSSKIAPDWNINNWHPSSDNNLYELLTLMISLGCQSVIAAGDTPDVVGFVNTLGELESFEDVRASHFFDNMTLIRDKLRSYVADNGWTKLQKARIGWLMSGTASSAWAARSTVNAAMQKLADDDPFSGYVDTTDLTFSDLVHYDTTSTITLGKRLGQAWAPIFRRQADAATQDAYTTTLAALRTKVKRRYERTDSGNDDNDAQLNQFINDALSELYLTLGSNAWFLRRTAPLTVSGIYPSTVDLPREVDRLLRIESSVDPGRQIPWKLQGTADQGRQRIVVHAQSGASYVGFYMVRPTPLEKDDDVAICPPPFIELVVVLTCKRLAEAGGNITNANYFAAETERLWRWAKREATRAAQGRQDGITPGDGYDHTINSGVPNALWNL